MKLELNKRYHLLAVQWVEGWEFDHPTVLLSPVIRVYEDGRSIEGVFEDFMIDGSIDIENGEETRSEDNHLNLKTLKRRAREAINGKEFPVAGYQAEEIWGKFVLNAKGEPEFVEEG